MQKMFPKNGEKNPEIDLKDLRTIKQRKFSELVTMKDRGSPRPNRRFITKEENGLNWIKMEMLLNKEIILQKRKRK